MNLWWVLLGTFFAALVAPIFWLLFIALLAVAIFKAAIAQKTVPSLTCSLSSPEDVLHRFPGFDGVVGLAEGPSTQLQSSK